MRVEPIFTGIDRDAFKLNGYTFNGKLTDDKAKDLLKIITDVLTKGHDLRHFQFSICDTQMILMIKGPKPDDLRLPEAPPKRKRRKRSKADTQATPPVSDPVARGLEEIENLDPICQLGLG